MFHKARTGRLTIIMAVLGVFLFLVKPLILAAPESISTKESGTLNTGLNSVQALQYIQPGHTQPLYHSGSAQDIIEIRRGLADPQIIDLIPDMDLRAVIEQHQLSQLPPFHFVDDSSKIGSASAIPELFDTLVYPDTLLVFSDDWYGAKIRKASESMELGLSEEEVIALESIAVAKAVNTRLLLTVAKLKGAPRRYSSSQGWLKWLHLESSRIRAALGPFTKTDVQTIQFQDGQVAYVQPETTNSPFWALVTILGAGKTLDETRQAITAFHDTYKLYFGDPARDEAQSIATTPFLYKPYKTSLTGRGYYDHTYPSFDNGGSPNIDGMLDYLGRNNTNYDTHDGDDFWLPYGSDVYAPVTGSVLSKGSSWVFIGYGNNYYIYIGHLSEVSVNENVTRGYPIGKSGRANNVDHIHFEVRHNGKQTDTMGWYGGGNDPCPLGPGATGNYKGCEASVWLWADESPPSTPPRIAVTPPHWDNVGEILTQLGYEWTEIQDSDLNEYNSIKQYDIIFANCSAAGFENGPNAGNALQQFVQNGGSFYASDYAYRYVDAAFPGYINFPDEPRIGNSQEVTANVVNQGLANYLNPSNPPSTISLNYNWGAWVVINGVASDTQVYLRGTFDIFDETSLLFHEARSREGLDGALQGQMMDKPLAVSFRPYGNNGGRVIYTTFHNEAQQTDIEKKMLEYLVLVPSTGELAAEAAGVVEANGGTVQQENIDTINPGEVSDPVNYVINLVKKLIFVANWGGSTLRLSVYHPDGSLYDQVESPAPPSSIVVDSAYPGPWSYEITGVDVPYNNYPYVVSIGESGGQMGDVSGDGSVNVFDALFILQYGVGLREESNEYPPPDGYLYMPSCDVSGDNNCNVFDALFIQQCGVGITNTFCP